MSRRKNTKERLITEASFPGVQPNETVDVSFRWYRYHGWKRKLHIVWESSLGGLNNGVTSGYAIEMLNPKATDHLIAFLEGVKEGVAGGEYPELAETYEGWYVPKGQGVGSVKVKTGSDPAINFQFFVMHGMDAIGQVSLKKNPEVLDFLLAVLRDLQAEANVT